MNKKHIFNKTTETKAHGSIRTAKWAKGAVATVALAGGFMAVSGNTVHAAEVTAPTATPTTAVATPAATTSTAPVAAPAQSAPVTAAATAPTTISTTTAGNVTTVTDSAQQAAVDAAQQAGVNVVEEKTPVDLGTAATKAEELAKQQEAAAKLAAEAAAVKEAQATYEAQVAAQKKNLGTTGYTNEVVNQSMKFDSEANANLAITGDFKYVDPAKAWDANLTPSENVKIALANEITGKNSSPITWVSSDSVKSTAVTVEAGKSIVATYTNLSNTTYAGKKISKVVITYTNANSTAKEVIYVAQDPTNGFISYSNGTESNKTTGAIQFFDANGKVISFSAKAPAVIALSSLNSQVEADGTTTNGIGEHLNQESIKDYNFNFVKINGSTIDEHSDGIYSSTNNDYKSKGSTYNNSEWDQAGNPLFYYGAGVGTLTSGDTIKFTSENRRTTNVDYVKGQWLAINTRVATPSVVTNPTVETHTYQYETVGDVTTVHVAEDGTVLIPKTTKVNDGATGTSYDVSQHDNTITTKDGKTYTFVGVTDNNKGTVVIGETNVVFTYKETFGTVTVGYKDTTGKIIKDPVVDTPTTSTGKPYDTTDNKPHVIKTDDGKTYLIVPGLTVGNETGQVKEGDTHVDYIYNELKVEKGVINEAGKDVNDGTLVIGEKAHYTLTGASVVASAFNDGKGQYAFEDDLDEAHDKYLGSHLILVKDITLEDGTVIKSGADLMKYAQEQYDGNIYKISLNSDFLKSIADKDELQVQAIIDFERIAAGDVENTAKNIINGEVVATNTVVTHTPEKPVTPETPAKPTAAKPVNKGAVAELPHTGETNSGLLTILGLASLMTVAFVSKKKRVN